MIRIVLFSESLEEIGCIRKLLSVYSMQHSWADCKIEVISSRNQLPETVSEIDILIADASHIEAVEWMKKVKNLHPPVLIFPIAGPDVPPTSYVRPEIMPCGLFWRPVSPQTAASVVEQIMASIHDQIIPPSQNSYRLIGKQKTQDIPFSMILYFEARVKKIALRMQAEELSFNGTLSQLEQELPPEFIRCHKSFLVNRRHIVSVDRSNSSLILDNRMELPISRSYKKAFWEVFQNGD